MDEDQISEKIGTLKVRDYVAEDIQRWLVTQLDENGVEAEIADQTTIAKLGTLLS